MGLKNKSRVDTRHHFVDTHSFVVPPFQSWQQWEHQDKRQITSSVHPSHMRMHHLLPEKPSSRHLIQFSERMKFSDREVKVVRMQWGSESSSRGKCTDKCPEKCFRLIFVFLLLFCIKSEGCSSRYAFSLQILLSQSLFSHNVSSTQSVYFTVTFACHLSFGLGVSFIYYCRTCYSIIYSSFLILITRL